MRRVNYMKRASRKFLEGTRYRTPADAVEAGVKTLTQWVDALNTERERDWLEQTVSGARAARAQEVLGRTKRWMS
jgi:hypothetical protein